MPQLLTLGEFGTVRPDQEGGMALTLEDDAGKIIMAQNWYLEFQKNIMCTFIDSVPGTSDSGSEPAIRGSGHIDASAQWLWLWQRLKELSDAQYMAYTEVAAVAGTHRMLI